MVLDGLPGLYGLKYDRATTCGLQLYLCSYKLVSSATDDMVAKVDIVFTTGLYAGQAVKPVITTSYSARRGPIGNGLAVICIIDGYLKTIGEGLGGE